MALVIQLKKICRRCEEEKFIQEFYLRRRRKNGTGRHSYCIECEKKRNAENYKARQNS